jgi:hypothetical protein
VDAGSPSPPLEFEDFRGNPRVADGDLDGASVVDMGYCELDELTGLIVGLGGSIAWDGAADPSVTFNLYRGLFSLFITACFDTTEHAGDCAYTQDPATVPEARRWCDLGAPHVTDPDSPPPGDGFLYLATAKGAAEGGLGFAQGLQRPNQNPCP